MASQSRRHPGASITRGVWVGVTRRSGVVRVTVASQHRVVLSIQYGSDFVFRTAELISPNTRRGIRSGAEEEAAPALFACCRVKIEPLFFLRDFFRVSLRACRAGPAGQHLRRRQGQRAAGQGGGAPQEEGGPGKEEVRMVRACSAQSCLPFTFWRLADRGDEEGPPRPVTFVVACVRVCVFVGCVAPLYVSCVSCVDAVGILLAGHDTQRKAIACFSVRLDGFSAAVVDNLRTTLTRRTLATSYLPYINHPPSVVLTSLSRSPHPLQTKT